MSEENLSSRIGDTCNNVLISGLYSFCSSNMHMCLLNNCLFFKRQTSMSFQFVFSSSQEAIAKALPIRFYALTLPLPIYRKFDTVVVRYDLVYNPMCLKINYLSLGNNPKRQ